MTKKINAKPIVALVLALVLAVSLGLGFVWPHLMRGESIEYYHGLVFAKQGDLYFFWPDRRPGVPINTYQFPDFTFWGDDGTLVTESGMIHKIPNVISDYIDEQEVKGVHLDWTDFRWVEEKNYVAGNTSEEYWVEIGQAPGYYHPYPCYNSSLRAKAKPTIGDPRDPEAAISQPDEYYIMMGEPIPVLIGEYSEGTLWHREASKSMMNVNGNSEQSVDNPVATTAPASVETPAPVVQQPATTTTTTGASRFPDVPAGAWYYDAVNALAGNGVIVGGTDGLFHPDKELTIGEWCTILWRLFGYKLPEGMTEAEDAASNYSYSTMSDHWASYAVNRCYKVGATSFKPGHQWGYWDYDLWATLGLTGKILEVSPESGLCDMESDIDKCDLVTQRGEAINAIVGVLRRLGRDAVTNVKYTVADIPDWDVIEKNAVPRCYVNGYPCYGNTHDWKAANILTAYNLGVVGGVDAAGTFAPSMPLTRAQVCQILYNAKLVQPVEAYHYLDGTMIMAP